jgi:hypothetical protein
VSDGKVGPMLELAASSTGGLTTFDQPYTAGRLNPNTGDLWPRHLGTEVRDNDHSIGARSSLTVTDFIGDAAKSEIDREALSATVPAHE